MKKITGYEPFEVSDELNFPQTKCVQQLEESQYQFWSALENFLNDKL